MYGAQHAAIPVTTSTIYGLPGFPFQYPTIPNTVPHTIMPKMPFMFPQNYGFCSTFDSSRNMNMFWLGKKIAAESSFNPACILNSESTGSNHGLENAFPQILHLHGKVWVLMCIFKAPSDP
jgi:hypothetical protein